MAIKKADKKLYYSLRQVAEMLSVPERTIKSWENRFSQLKPARNRAGNRQFTEKDVQLLFQLKSWLLEEKRTDEEVRQLLSQRQEREAMKQQILLKRILAEVKLEVQEILRLLREGT